MPELHVLSETGDFPIRCEEPIHHGKVRTVYTLSLEESRKLAGARGFSVGADAQLAVMVISDRISAFECHWVAEGEMAGVPGKGAALNAIAAHWFQRFKESGLGNHHIVDIPHPLVWIVQKARPIMMEAIARQYITGSMWRAYQKGKRTFGGQTLSDDLTKNQRLDDLLLTPSTKGILSGIPGVPEVDDTPVPRQLVREHWSAFAFEQPEHVAQVEEMLRQGFAVISKELDGVDQIFVDTKFEFGYVTNAAGDSEILYMDEVGTPDSSRMWDKSAYEQGEIVDYCKESFRQFLLETLDRDILTTGSRIEERKAMAAQYRVPLDEMMDVSNRYRYIAEQITGQPLTVEERPHEAIQDALASYGLLR
ncbi:MAG: phosphoribosylaminoimidazolesuccinocarboxamide synthase [Deltaproteobacteria bacterium]|nr:MAG: phosphoribosylaminoimidazolesuccinocarboxamide synthase [Deltaproteobacteria bacterium]